MRDTIRFYLNGAVQEVSGNDVFLSLSDFLRKRKGLTGTKVVCAEGDCGSCTVLVGRINLESGNISYDAVTSCILIIFQLDAKHVITIEGLRDGQGLNSIQQAMVSCQASQCGFCTPGFVVALQGLMDDDTAVDADIVRRGLTGNLCRCTGYDSIIRAALTTERGSLKSIETLYPQATFKDELAVWASEEVFIATVSKKFFKPVTIGQAAQFRIENPGSVVIAGGTDLGVVYNKRIREINVAISLGDIISLRKVMVESESLRVGSGVTLGQLKDLADVYLPELGRFMNYFGSPLIRNAGTIGGNLVTGSPIGDTIPAMMVLGAVVELAGKTGTRTVPIASFYSGYRQTILAPDELLASIKIPLLGQAQIFKLYKVSRRKDLDISSFGAAIWMEITNGIVKEIRIAFGGVGPMVMRLIKTEDFLRGAAASLEQFEKAGKFAKDEVMPITDVRGSEKYRRTLAANILSKFWHEVIGNSAIEPPR